MLQPPTVGSSGEGVLDRDRPVGPRVSSKESPARRSLPRSVALALLGAGYFAAGKLGLSLALVHASASAVWPPTGIALAGLLILGYRVWPVIFAGAFLVNLTTAGDVATSAGIAVGNTLEAVLGAYLINRYAGGRNAFLRSRDTFRFAFLAGIVSTMVSATVGVTTLMLGGYARWADYPTIWVTWWLGDLGGALIVAPALLLWIGRWRVRWSSPRALEAALLLLSVLVVGQFVFDGGLPDGDVRSSLMFLCMPLLVWAAYRFDRRVAAAAILLTTAIAVWGAFHQAGSAEPRRRNESLVVLQVFMGVAAMTTLALAAAVAERRRAAEEARIASEELHDAMSELEAFSRSVSHDLRSPLGAILGSLEALNGEVRRKLDHDERAALRRARVAAESVDRLVEQLAQFSWAEGEARGNGPVDMTALAREARAEVIAGLEGAGLVRFEIGDLPPARGNTTLLVRVFLNLFSNAVKFHRQLDDHRVEVGGHSGAGENVYYVADNGIGFDPLLGDIVFQPFRRLAGDREIAGSGLGLAIVARIVRKHGGRVWAESDGATGARFCFALPRPVE